MKPVLKVEDLSVILNSKKSGKVLVENSDFEVYPGECLGILGESGSGKSMTVKSVLGLLEVHGLKVKILCRKEKKVLGQYAEKKYQWFCKTL